MTIKNTGKMIAAMTPELRPGRWVFCCTHNPKTIADTAPEALAVIQEDEGVTLVLPPDVAAAHGFAASLCFKQITLTVFSDLEGIGLTAAVAKALTIAQIPCNVIAAFHHDHILVPESVADQAMDTLQALQRSSQSE